MRTGFLDQFGPSAYFSITFCLLDDAPNQTREYKTSDQAALTAKYRELLDSGALIARVEIVSRFTFDPESLITGEDAT